ncbi:MAG: aldehyde dehydrogenase family protein, partial [Gemmatimonadaceae bacterium]
GILWGRFANCGQTCVAPKRVFVASEVYDRFVAAMAERVRQLHVLGSDDTNNDPTSPQHDVTDDMYDMYDMYDMGALIRESQRESLAALRDDALQRGGKIHGGDGNAAIANVALGGNRFSPTLLLDLPANARALHEETFGPLLPIIRVSDESAMIAMANDSEFGLSASVWTRDRARGRAIAKRLDAGTVVINDVALIAGVAEVPHGGVKQSGTGRAHGTAGLEECVRTKTIVDDIFSSWRQPWWFGYGTRALERMDGYVRLSHGGTVRQRLSGIASTIALVFRPERPL